MVVRSGRPVVDEADESAVWKLRMGGGLRAFDEAFETLAAAGVRVCVRPHAADVVSDLPGTLGVLRRFEGKVEVLAAPGDLVTPEMVRSVGDHMLRAAATLAEVPGVAGFVLEDVAVDVGRVVAVAPGTGLVPERVWREVGKLVRASGKAMVVDGAATADRLRWVLGLSA